MTKPTTTRRSLIVTAASTIPATIAIFATIFAAAVISFVNGQIILGVLCILLLQPSWPLKVQFNEGDFVRSKKLAAAVRNLLKKGSVPISHLISAAITVLTILSSEWAVLVLAVAIPYAVGGIYLRFVAHYVSRTIAKPLS